MSIEKILNSIKNCFEKIPDSDTRANIGPRNFITYLIFGFFRDRGESRTLESLRRTAQSHSGEQIGRGTFWERLQTKRLKTLLELLISVLVKKISLRLSLTSQLLTFLNVTSILLIDSSSSGLPKDAKKAFPAPRNNVAPAAIKLHLCFDILKGAVHWFQFTPATTHDRKCFPPLTSLIGKLIIFDLGYNDYSLFKQINNIGGFFLSRVKTNADITIRKVISGVSKKLEGRKLLDIKSTGKKSKIIELVGEFSKNKKPFFSTRVIGFWNPIAQQYHWYVTNLSAHADIIYPLYRLRWQIELIFKTLKSSLRLADLPSANTNIIQNLCYAALIASIIAHPLANTLTLEDLKIRNMAPSLQRAGMLLCRVSAEFINFLTADGFLQTLVNKLSIFKNELFDPNRNKRPSSLAVIAAMIKLLQ